MTSSIRSILICGILWPLLATGIILGLCGAGFWKFYTQSNSRMQTYAQYSAEAQRLSKTSEENRLVISELERLRSTLGTDSVDGFLARLRATAVVEPGFRFISSTPVAPSPIYGEKARAEQIELEGLSDYLVTGLGEAFRDSPGIFADSWHLGLNRDGTRLHLTLILTAEDKHAP